MAELDAKLKKYYRDQALPAERVDAIIRSGRGGVAGWARWRWAWVATVVLLVGGGWYQTGNVSGVDAVLAEIVANHHKGVRPDIVSARYDVVQGQLPRLSFSILSSKAAFLHNYTLVGGRYCSLQGELAAQLRVADRVDGDTLTVYVCKLAAALEGMAPLEKSYEGVDIRLWEDGDRLFALARSRD
jgi:hypothetical protein